MSGREGDYYYSSLLVERVKFEPESSSSQVPFLLFSFSFCFVFVFIKGSDCDSCFHNDAPTDVRSIKHERDTCIIVKANTRIHCSVANYEPQFSLILAIYNFPERVCPILLVTKASVTMPSETHVLGKLYIPMAVYICPRMLSWESRDATKWRLSEAGNRLISYPDLSRFGLGMRLVIVILHHRLFSRS